MLMSNKTYDILKWIALICIPAIATFYVALAPVWGWPLADEVAKTSPNTSRSDRPHSRGKRAGSPN